MRKKIFMSCLSLGFVGLMASCSSTDAEENGPSKADAKGQLVLNLAASNAFKSATRAVNEQDYLNTNNYTIQVLDADNRVKHECPGSEADVPITLSMGNYKVKAFYGDPSVAASTEGFYVEGTQNVTVKAAQTVSATVNCVAQAAKVVVNFSSEMQKYLSDYSVFFDGTSAFAQGAGITWAKDQKNPIYFLIAGTSETLNYTINLTCKDNYLLNAQTGATTGSVERSFTVQRNKSYNINVDLNVTSPGGLSLTITIDETLNEHPITWTVPVDWTK